jgi:hypothetical protein
VIDGKVRKNQGSSAGSTGAAMSSSAAQASPPVILASRRSPSFHDPFFTCKVCEILDERRPDDAVIASGYDLVSHAHRSTRAEAVDWFRSNRRRLPDWMQEGVWSR